MPRWPALESSLWAPCRRDPGPPACSAPRVLGSLCFAYEYPRGKDTGKKYVWNNNQRIKELFKSFANTELGEHCLNKCKLFQQ